MLKVIRKEGVYKKILWVLAVIIILSFGVFGTASYLGNTRISQNYAGKIFGRTISLKEFQENYQRAQHQALLQYGENYEKISQFLNLEAETWDRLILTHEAKKRRLTVSDKEVVDAIAQFPLFQRNGSFDRLLYNDLLRYAFKTRPRDFEEGIRETLLFSQIYKEEIGKIIIPEEEVKEAYRKQNEKIQVTYVLVPTDEFLKAATVTPEDIQTYFAEHKLDFMVPPAINVEFMKIGFPENADATAKQTTTDLANEAHAALMKNPDFKSVGAQFKLEPKESGFFSAERPNLNLGWSFELLQQVLSLAANEIPAPIETEEGFYLVRVKEKQDAKIPELAEVQALVENAVRQQKAKELSRTKSQEIANQLKTAFQNSPDKNFNALAQGMNLTVQQSPLFSRGQYLPSLGIAKEFQDAAFALTTDQPVSPAVDTPKGYAILHLDSLAPIDEAQFAAEKENFRQGLLVEKNNAKFNELISRLRLQANLEDNLSKLKQRQN